MNPFIIQIKIDLQHNLFLNTSKQQYKFKQTLINIISKLLIRKTFLRTPNFKITISDSQSLIQFKMSESLYFIFQVNNPNLKFIREFKTILQGSENNIIIELKELNKQFASNNSFTMDKIKLVQNETFDYLFKPSAVNYKFKTYFEARRMILTCQDF